MNSDLQPRFPRVPIYTRNAIFALVGVLLVIAAATLDPQAHSLMHAVSLNLGLVAIAVVCVDLLWRLAGGNPIQEQISDLSKQIRRLAQTVDVIENSKTIGLEAVYDCTGNFGSKRGWLLLMEEAKGTMDLMGRALFEWVRALELGEIIQRKIEKDGVTIRWLIMSQTNRYLRLLDEEGQPLAERVESKLQPAYDKLMNIKESLSSESRGKSQIKIFDHVPLYCSVIRIDDKFLVTPYLSVAGARDCPLFSIRGEQSPWAQSFRSEFDAI